MKKNFVLSVAVTALLSPLMASSTEAAMITWGAPTTISGVTDVSTNRFLVGAFNVGDTGVAGTTVNGVAFTPLVVASGTTFALTGLGAGGTTFDLVTGTPFSSTNTAFGFAAAPFSALAPAYQTLLAAGTLTTDPFGATLLMSGLTPGQDYEFQWWANWSIPGAQLHSATGDFGGGTVTLNDNTTNANGGVGQYAIGTFTADDDFQSINLTGPQSALINGFQLRAIPEPSTVLFGLALVGACFGSRRRSSAAAKQS